MFKVAIIDDEQNVRIVIKKLLGILFSNCEVVLEAASIKEALIGIPNTQPDIVLLDIELEDGTGFSLLNQLPTVDFKLVFITAFNEFAIKAFKYNALDYLLKPVDPTELENAVVKAQKRVLDGNELRKILENAKEEKPSQIVVKTMNKLHFIDVDDILYCQAEGAYASIRTKRDSVLASKNLKHFEEVLSERGFVRTHQSYLVNIAQIELLKHNVLILKDKTEIPISIRRKSSIVKLLKL